MTRENFGYLGKIVLGFTCIVFGVTMVLPLAIPAWAIGGMFIVSGVLLLIGK